MRATMSSFNGLRLLRRQLCTADSYKGPGGLSAREIMGKIHEAKARDAGVQREHAREVGKRAADLSADAARAAAKPTADNGSEAASIPLQKLQNMGTADLVQLLVARGINFSDCREHSALLERASVRLGARPQQRANHHPAFQREVPASHLRGMAVDRSSADKKDDL